MGKVQSEGQKDAALDAWIEDMMSACDIASPSETAELSADSAAKEGNVLYEIPLFSIEEDASAEDKAKMLDSEIDKILEKLGQAKRLAKTIPEGPYNAAFQTAKDVFSGSVNEAVRKHSSLSSLPADDTAIAELEEWIVQAYKLYGDVEAAAQNATRSIDQIVARLLSQSAELSNELEIQYSVRAALAKTGANLDEVDKAYTTAKDALKDVDTSIKIPKPEMAEEALDRVRIWSDELTRCIRATKRDKDAQLAAILLKLSLVERDVSTLAESKSIVEDTKCFAKEFNIEHKAAQQALSQTRATIENSDYVSANKFLSDAEEHQANMHRFVLCSTLYPNLNDLADGSITKISLSDPEQKTLFKDIIELRRHAEQIYKDKTKIEASGNDAGQFEVEFKNVMALTKSAQFDIVDGSYQDATTKNDQAKHSIKNMSDIQQNMTSAANDVIEQIEQLKIAALPVYEHYPEVHTVAQNNEQYQIVFKRFSKQVADLNSFINSAEQHVKVGEVVEADEKIKQAQQPLDELLHCVKGFAQIPLAIDAGNLGSQLTRDSAKTRADCDKLTAQADKFSEDEELEIFEIFSQKAMRYLDNADEAIDQDATEDARGYLKIAQISLDGMLTAFERGVPTSVKTLLFMSDIKDFQSKIRKLYERRKEITNEKLAMDFLGYNSTAGAVVFEAEALVNAGNIKDARELLIRLPMCLSNMEACFNSSEDFQENKEKTSETTGDLTAENSAFPTTLGELLAILLKLQNGLTKAETEWRPKLAGKLLHEFDDVWENAKQAAARATALAEGETEDKNETNNDLRTVLMNADILYRKLWGIFRAGLTEAIEDNETEISDPKEEAVVKIGEDMKRLRLSIEHAYLDWSPELTHEKISDMDEAYHSSLQSLNKANNLIKKYSKQGSFVLPQLQSCVSDAKAEFTLMQKIYESSEEIKVFQLQSLKDGISYHLSRFDMALEKLGNAVDWDIDLSATEVAYNKGMTAITDLKTAIMNRDIDVAELNIDTIEEAISELKSAIESVLSELSDLQAEYSSKISEMISQYSELSSQSNMLLYNESALKKFLKASELTSNLLKTATKMIGTSTQADCDSHFNYIESRLNVLQSILPKT